MTDSKIPELPIRQNFTRSGTITLIVALIVGLMSVLGLVFPQWFYLPALAAQSRANDVLSLVIGLPILLLSLSLAKRGRLFGLLFWPGALLYSVYNYIACIFAVPFGLASLAYLVIVLLGVYGVFLVLKSFDPERLHKLLAGSVYESTSGWALVILGVLFVFLAVGLISDASKTGVPFALADIGVPIADIVLSAAWIASGVLLLRRKPLGYASGLGNLFAGTALFISVILVLVLESVFANTPLQLADITVLFFMGLFCFIPFGLFLRGVLRKA